MSNFKPFAAAVYKTFTSMSKHELFTTIDGNLLWDEYLKAFPVGTNNVYRVRTEYDCSCCKNFVKNIGPLVSVINGVRTSVWDSADTFEYPFNIVASRLKELVHSHKITGLFRTSETKYGSESTLQRLDSGEILNWNHFYAKIADKHHTRSVGQITGEYETKVGVFRRGLTELTDDAFTTVLDLIESNALYRGQEFLRSVKEFASIKTKYNALPESQREDFVWETTSNSSSLFRNTVIGTLVQDLSSGMETESAVRSYESKVAPTNYKRPTALITPKMINEALKTVSELGYELALERRFANISDVSVNNVLWVDTSVQGKMRNGIEAVLMDAATKSAPSKKNKAIDISIVDFMNNVVPKAKSMSAYIENNHTSNFVALTAPVHADSGKLFKWDNNFGWSYDGNITDSIKEKVKKAGGNVTNAKLRVSLAWSNYDDLDLHADCPNGEHIYYCNKRQVLDVDMNAGYGRSREPVENMSWKTLIDGVYKISVNQYSKRESSDVGFTIEIENDRVVTQLSYPKPVTGTINVVDITVKNGKVTDIKVLNKNVVGGSGFSIKKWGVDTESFVKVNTLMYSPNYWDDNAIGNKHWFFILDQCKSDDRVRGIYNEFLNPELDKHRKVFEVLGDKTKCVLVDDQLCGVGFSSTQRNNLLVDVDHKLYNVTF